MNTAAICVRGLHKTFDGVTVLDSLDLHIGYGEIYGLLGANGAGKSTAVRLLCGLLAADAGSGGCLGRPLGSALPELGYVPQRGNLYNDLTIRENLTFFAAARALDSVSQRVQSTLVEHGLVERAGQRVGSLSGGWRQRVAFAAALLHQPRLLVLDEPGAGLDLQARARLWAAIRQQAEQHGSTVLVTTHYAEEAARCDRVGYLHGGRLVAEGRASCLASALGLAVWQIDVARPIDLPVLPQQATFCMTRSADGWRLIVVGNALPVELVAWCAHHAAVMTAVAPQLEDALIWLGRDPLPA